MPLRRRQFTRALLGLTAGVGLAGRLPAPASAARNAYFDLTGHNVSDPFLGYFEHYGGVPILGLPLTETFKDGDLIMQYFERARFEWHPDNPPGWQVELGQLGREVSVGRQHEAPFRPVAATAGGAFFPQTGHTLRGAFRDFWNARGGLPLFGYPLSEEFVEKSPTDGKPYLVQYFERNRFEYHNDFAGTPYAVQLGLLGRQSFAQRGYNTALLAPAKALPKPQPQALHLPALMYHRIGGGAERYQLPMSSFRQQLDWLVNNGYTSITLPQMYDYLFEGGDLPKKPVMLTFDDGWAGQYAAAQELNARGLTGVFFIIAGYAELSDAQIRQIAAWGHEIESHTMSHPYLTKLADAQLAYEVNQSKRSLEARFGGPIQFLAYPDGDYNGRVMDAVAAAGYRGGIAAWGGGYWTSQKRWNEPRIEVSGFSSLGDFVDLVVNFAAATLPPGSAR